MNERWDAIVVGAGPAGAALSIRLAQAGVKVLLLDRAQFPRDKLCGEFLSPDCWPTLELLGVAETMRSSGFQPIESLRLWIDAHDGIETALPRQRNRPAVGLSRSRLDHMLIRRARQVGVTIGQGTRIVSLIGRDTTVLGVRIRPVGSSARATDLFAKLVVAADGRRSQVVHESGRVLVDWRSTPSDVCAVKRHFRATNAIDPADGIELHSFPGGYAGICRVEFGIVNLCTLVPIDLVRRARGNIARALHDAFGHNRAARWLDQAEPLGDWKTVPEVRLQQSRPTSAGVLYVGDAMGTVDPLGGEGMTMALQGAVIAARYVEQAVQQRSGCDRTLQQNYQHAWIRRFAQRTRFCRWFSWLLARPTMLRPLLLPSHRTLAQALLRLAFRITRDRAGLSLLPVAEPVEEML